MELHDEYWCEQFRELSPIVNGIRDAARKYAIEMMPHKLASDPGDIVTSWNTWPRVSDELIRMSGLLDHPHLCIPHPPKPTPDDTDIRDLSLWWWRYLQSLAFLAETGESSGR